MTAQETQRRRTKILATLGPAVDSPEVLTELFKAGVDAVRLNFSHGSAEDHINRAKEVREIAESLNREVAIVADLQGPKIRVAKFVDGAVKLANGDAFFLDASLEKEAGTAEGVGLDYENLHQDVEPGTRLMIDDGRIVLAVERVAGTRIHCTVVDGGKISNNKGINKEGGGLSADALTDKDKQDIKVAAQLGADYVAISFARDANDVATARTLLQQTDSHAGIITKIERKEAVDNMEELIKASDVIMVARGDLGVEIGDAELPAVQKKLIGRARALDKAVITATQMMESMIYNPIPTRAEVFDVANAVLDGTDAVMLSAETAAGKHPVKAVEAMSRACLGAERQKRSQISGHRLECEFNAVDEAIAMATMYTANHLPVKAIVALTESGLTPLWMSRIRSGIPIFALSRHTSTLRKIMLYRGVYPILFDATKIRADDINNEAIKQLHKLEIVESKDLVILTRGDFIGVHGGSNTMKIVYAGAVI